MLLIHISLLLFNKPPGKNKKTRWIRDPQHKREKKERTRRHLKVSLIQIKRCAGTQGRANMDTSVGLKERKKGSQYCVTLRK